MQSVLTDCPDREKGPYTGDNLHNIDTELTLFDMQAYQGQMVNNMRTAQRRVPANGQFPGLIANIAPEYHFVPPSATGTWFLDEPNWGGAVIMVPWNLYEVYGDTKAMKVNYESMLQWLDWEATTKAANNGNIRGLGDWSAAQSTTAQAVIDYGYYRGANTMAKIAALLGKTADADKYCAARREPEGRVQHQVPARRGRRRRLVREQHRGLQRRRAGRGPRARPVPRRRRRQPRRRRPRLRQPDRHRLGRDRPAVPHAARRRTQRRHLRHRRQPGLPGLRVPGQQRAHDAEREPQRRQLPGPPLPGQVASWFVHGLVGIQQAPGSTATAACEIKPALVGTLNHAEGTYTTPQGVASANWTRAANGLLSSLAVTVPANTDRAGVRAGLLADGDVRRLRRRRRAATSATRTAPRSTTSAPAARRSCTAPAPTPARAAPSRRRSR